MQGSGSMKVDSRQSITSIAHLGKMLGELEPLKGIKADCGMVIFVVFEKPLGQQKRG